MDIIDRKLLCELDQNCRTPLSQIAKKLRIGRNVADYRIKRLEKKGIIRAYIATTNLALLGYKTYRIYFKTQHHEKQKEFVQFLIKQKMK